MEHALKIKSLFDEWAIEDGALSMSREHWARVEPVLSEVAVSAGRYLEIGPGNGYALEYMARTKFATGQCYAVELSHEMARICAEKTCGFDNVVIEVGDFLDWNFGPNRFDLIFSMEVFYYFEDIFAAIVKSASLLADGGELVVMVDYYDESSASEAWSSELGVRLTRWSKNQYLDAFKAAGLQDVLQEEKWGGVLERGLTLCTRGVRQTNFTLVGKERDGDISS